MACLSVQLFTSACSKTAVTPPSLPAAGEQASSAADGGVMRDDAGTTGAAGATAGSAAPGQAGSGSKDAGAPRKPVPTDARDAGSDASNSTPDASASLDIEALSQSLAKAVCASLRTCLGEQKLRAFVDSEVCEDRFAAGFAQGDFGTLQDSIDRGRVEVHADSLEACYADTRALGCAIQTQRLPASCQAALKGTVAQGGTCTSGEDCAGAAFCANTACPRLCSARLAAAESCAGDEECKSGLICVQGQCALPAVLGAACGGTTGAVCALGTSCIGSTKDVAGQCATNADVQVGAVSDVCTPGGTLCKEGLSCAYDGDQGFNCQPPSASGEPCHLALPTQCPTSEYCTAEDVTIEGRCAALPTDGESCVLGSECAGGHVCLSAADDAVICRRVRDLGEACEVDAMCRSARCAQGKCAATEVCD